MKRQDIFCCECRTYIEGYALIYCPFCGSDDVDVYPMAYYYNKKVEERIKSRRDDGIGQTGNKRRGI
jgi:hypothetical protein